MDAANSELAGARPTCARMEADRSHLPSLDGTRAISILLVLLGHFVSYHYVPGGLGVQVFFVISGLLITRLMFAECKETGHFDVVDFLLRRVFRLFPVAFVYCAIVSITILTFARDHFDGGELLAAIFYVENYFVTWRQAIGHPTTMPFMHFWSLSVEEQFYLGFALLALFWRPSPKRVLFGAIVATIIPPIIRLHYAATTPAFLADDSIYIYAHTETRIDSIAAGVLIAAACEFEVGRHFLRYVTRPLPVLAAVVAIGLCYAPGLHDEFFRDTWRFTIVNLSIAVLLAEAVFGDTFPAVNRLLNWGPMRRLGVWSYSVYIWHVVIGGWIAVAMKGLPLIIVAPTKIVVVVAAAAASYTYIERPAKGLKEFVTSKGRLLRTETAS